MREVTPAEWQAFADTRPESLLFHHINWLNLLSRHYGFLLKIMCVEENGAIKAGIPFLSCRSLRGARRLVSLPFTDYVPPLYSDEPALETLLEEIAEKYGPEKDIIEIRWGVPGPIAQQERTERFVMHVLDFDGGHESVAKKFSSATRRNIIKAGKAGLSFEQSTERTGLEEFYRLHTLTRHYQGVPVQPKKFIMSFKECLFDHGLGFVQTVRKGGRAIAAAVFLVSNKTVIYKYGASDRAFLGMRPNNLLFNEVIRWAIANGHTALHFGVTDKDQEGLKRFKRGWGAEERPLRYSFLPARQKTLKPVTGTNRMIRTVIRRSPVPVCRVLGELFYKYAV